MQVSLPGDGSPESTAKLGKALAPLRYARSVDSAKSSDQGYGIMGTGQAVHNLRDLCEIQLPKSVVLKN
jgi:aromatic ring-opening dioxygenase catalytic subunit (LigB family)